MLYPKDNPFLDIQPEACLHSLFKEYPYHPCTDACPKGAIELQPLKINPDRCDGCGICISICPTDAISLDAGYKQAIESGISEGRPVRIRCSMVQVEGKDVPCLGMLDYPILAGLMSKTNTDLELISGPCNNCEKSPGGDVALRSLKTANGIMSLFGRRERGRIINLEVTNGVDGKGYTRREVFRGLGSTLKRLMTVNDEAMEPERWSRGSVPEKRKDFLRLVGELEKYHREADCDVPLPFYDKEIGRRCNGCNGLWRCVTFCPTGALSLYYDGHDSEAGIDFESMRCIGCRLCEIVCPEGAVTSLSIAAPIYEKKALIRLRAGKCERCEAPLVNSEGLCYDCSQREKKLGWASL